jgi:prepilin-type N-terminal cleavage/methylation domain-containing protein
VTGRRNGFTLIELMVVVLILGILVAIALPKFSSTRNKARLASIKSDIHNIQVSQEAHYSVWNQYGNLNQLKNRTKLVLSDNNTATVTGNAKTFTATVQNAAITSGPSKCTYIYGGTNKNNGILTCN